MVFAFIHKKDAMVSRNVEMVLMKHAAMNPHVLLTNLHVSMEMMSEMVIVASYGLYYVIDFLTAVTAVTRTAVHTAATRITLCVLRGLYMGKTTEASASLKTPGAMVNLTAVIILMK